MKNHEAVPSRPATIEKLEPMVELLGELRMGLIRYWSTAEDILKECGVTMVQPDESAYSVARNFFTLLFLYSYYRVEIEPERRILYAGTLQCLRGMVTGCDNLLDDEYKITLETDIPQTGHRFRSVVDIMISDRVLFKLLLDAAMRGDITQDLIEKASAASMKSMTTSGIQEASEEAGVEEILEPESVLSTVHHFKTGLLFTCPWDIPEIMEEIEPSRLHTIKKSLYMIGVGCQLMDDIVDIRSDIQMKRHNYLVSMIFHGSCEDERRLVKDYLRRQEGIDIHAEAFSDFPRSTALVCSTAKEFLSNGLNALFRKDHRFLVSPALQFLQQRIGVDLDRSSI